jgi:hypothetical protein
MRLVILTLLLAGCATSGSNSREAYFMISKGEASLLYRAFVGGIDYCKVTQYNLGSTEFIAEVKYDGDSCIVEAAANDVSTD